MLFCSNDAFDADMNVDGNKPESVVNLTGNRNGVLAAAWGCFAVGASWLWSLVTGQVLASIFPVHTQERDRSKLMIVYQRVASAAFQPASMLADCFLVAVNMQAMLFCTGNIHELLVVCSIEAFQTSVAPIAYTRNSLGKDT